MMSSQKNVDVVSHVHRIKIEEEFEADDVESDDESGVGYGLRCKRATRCASRCRTFVSHIKMGP